MKSRTFLLQAAFLCLTMGSQAQVKNDSTTLIVSGDSLVIVGKDGNRVFTKVEVEATFPGGDNGWRTYIINNLDPEVPIRKKAKRGTYQVIIRFIVNKDGVIGDVVAETSFGHGMEEEATRVITNGPKWSPAYQHGKPVNAYRRQPITFVVQ